MKNNTNNTNVTVKGIGFTGLLQITFIILKLCKIINWSWFWVLSPLWISTSFSVIIFIILIIILVKG